MAGGMTLRRGQRAGVNLGIQRLSRLSPGLAQRPVRPLTDPHIWHSPIMRHFSDRSRLTPVSDQVTCTRRAAWHAQTKSGRNNQ